MQQQEEKPLIILPTGLVKNIGRIACLVFVVIALSALYLKQNMTPNLARNAGVIMGSLFGGIAAGIIPSIYGFFQKEKLQINTLLIFGAFFACIATSFGVGFSIALAVAFLFIILFHLLSLFRR